MKRINVVFENDFDDVDVLLVPDYIANNLPEVTQNFFDWLAVKEHQQPFERNSIYGGSYVAIGTHEFVWWLNEYATRGNDCVIVFKEHTTLFPEYPIAEF